MLRSAPATSLSVSRFFESVCPQLLSLQSEAAAELGGSLAFRVFGDDSGAWFVDLDSASVGPIGDRQADLLLELQSEDFLAMLSGTLNVADAINAGRVRYHGDTSTLVKFGALLEVAG